MMTTNRQAAPAVALILSLGLSGCIAAVPLLLVGEAGAIGFESYKLVQTSSGGNIRVGFPGKDGKETAVQPLPMARRVAIWPADQGNVRFAEKLAASGRFDVTPPGRVSSILANVKLSTDLRQLTEQEQTTAFGTVCEGANAELVFASRDLGQTSDANSFSLSRAKITYKADLVAFSCSKRSIVWHDQIALIIEIGDKTASIAEMAQAGGDAWADRVMQAPTA